MFHWPLWPLAQTFSVGNNQDSSHFVGTLAGGPPSCPVPASPPLVCGVSETSICVLTGQEMTSSVTPPQSGLTPFCLFLCWLSLFSRTPHHVVGASLLKARCSAVWARGSSASSPHTLLLGPGTRLHSSHIQAALEDARLAFDCTFKFSETSP